MMFVRVRSMSESFVGSGREFLTPVTLLSGAEAFKRASAVTNGAAHQRIEVAKLAVNLLRAISRRSVLAADVRCGCTYCVEQVLPAAAVLGHV